MPTGALNATTTAATPSDYQSGPSRAPDNRVEDAAVERSRWSCYELRVRPIRPQQCAGFRVTDHDWQHMTIAPVSPTIDDPCCLGAIGDVAAASVAAQHLSGQSVIKAVAHHSGGGSGADIGGPCSFDAPTTGQRNGSMTAWRATTDSLVTLNTVRS